jgi:hypothetical protein
MTDDQHTILPLPVWFALLVTLLFGCPSNVYSAPIFKAQGSNGSPVSLRLLQEPCHEKVSKHIRPEMVQMFKRSILYWEGKLWESCWLDHGGVIHSVDEEGVILEPIPRILFKEDSV